MVTLTTLLLIGDARKGVPLRALSQRSGQFEVAAVGDPLAGEAANTLHSLAKSSDFIILCGDGKSNKLAADEIWHLLRNKIVVSLEMGTSISELRDTFPLSKVSRCRLCIDAPTEKTLSLFSHDSSFSDADLSSVKGLLGSMGEVLNVEEIMFVKLNREIDRSMTAFADLVSSLGTSMGIDQDLFEYTLGWVLYGLGSAIAGGMDLCEVLPHDGDGRKEEGKAVLRHKGAKNKARTKKG